MEGRVIKTVAGFIHGPEFDATFSSTSRKGSLFAHPVSAEVDEEEQIEHTNDVSEALAAVLAAFEADEALDGAEEAVLRKVTPMSDPTIEVSDGNSP